MNIPFLSFSGMHDPLKTELSKVFEKVYDSHWYMMGNNLKEFEKNYSIYSKTKYSIGVANGLDALIISLVIVVVFLLFDNFVLRKEFMCNISDETI